MDIMTIIGLIIGLTAIAGGNLLEGGHTESLMIFTAFFIVFGGTLGAVMVQTPLKIFLLSLKRSLWMIIPPKNNFEATIEKIVEWSQTARKEGLLSLQELAEEETDAFSKNGLQMLADGNEPESVRGILEVELSAAEDKDLQAAKVFEGFGGYSPTIGIIGAVMGLIHVMENLSNPEALGPGIAVALRGNDLRGWVWPTWYSCLWRARCASQSLYREMIIDGLVSIAEGENPATSRPSCVEYL